jgi:hypothetical protein
MAMGKRTRDRQLAMWVTMTDLPTAASHPFYQRLNQLLREHGFDDFAEAQFAPSPLEAASSAAAKTVILSPISQPLGCSPSQFRGWWERSRILCWSSA